MSCSVMHDMNSSCKSMLQWQRLCNLLLLLLQLRRKSIKTTHGSAALKAICAVFEQLQV